MILHLIYIYIKSLLGINVFTWLFTEVNALLARIMAFIKFLGLDCLSSFTHLLNISLDIISGPVNRATLSCLLGITHYCVLGWCLYFHVDRSSGLIGKYNVATSISIAHYSSVLFLEGAHCVKSYFSLCFHVVHIDDSIDIF